MKKTILFSKISVSYWIHHKKRLLVFALTIILGCLALYSTGMLIRSNKQARLDLILRNIGNYEYIVYDISQEDAKKIANLEQVDDFGIYYRLGYVISGNATRTGAACFDDKHSECIYHLNCEKGHYPENENEIAIDKRTARLMGINPEIGNKISLQLFSYYDNNSTEDKFTICGIFEASDANIVGGWRRYPSWTEKDAFEMPGVFFYSDYKYKYATCNVTEFIQSEDANTLATNISSKFTSIDKKQHNNTLGRLFAYGQILGLSQFQNGSILSEKYGGVTLANIIQAMRNGDARFDFYSAVVIPIFSIIISIIVIISIAGITRNIICDKQENFAIMRSLGLKNSELIFSVIVDFMFMTTIFIFIGLIIGTIVHISMISLLNYKLGLNLVTGYTCSEVVIAATHDPLPITIAVVFISVLVPVIIVPLKYIEKMPVLLFDSKNLNKHKIDGSNKIIINKWDKIISHRIGMYSHSASLIAIIVMSTALLGFTYFHALAVKDNGSIDNQKEYYGLEDWDYIASTSNQSTMYNFNIESHHDRGLDPEKVEELSKKPFVMDSLGKIVNRSTKVSYSHNDMDTETLSIWSEFNLRKESFANDNNEFEIAVRDAENAMINAIGYSNNEEIFYVPTVGLSEKELIALNSNVINGSINIDKLNSGEEVIVAISKMEEERFGSIFHSGDTIPLSDILLSNEEEQLDFASLIPSKVSYPVYKNNVKTPEGNDIELTSYAFGKRINIGAKVGAVVVLDDKLTKRYLVFAGERHYGINLLCTYGEFSAWGMPNNKLTDLSIKVDNNKASVREIDESWYNAICDANGISFSSSSDIVNEVISGTRKTMSVYYCIIVMLILQAAVMTAIILYTNIRIKSRKFAILRACGMSVNQLAYIVIKSNLIYPLIGILFSLIPTAICNSFLKYISKKIMSGEWSLDAISGETPWYLELPWGANLFSYKVPQTMIVIFFAYIILMLMVTLPQMYYISKRTIATELDKSEF